MESTAYILLLCDVCTVYIQLEIGDVIYAAFVLLLPLAGVFLKCYLVELRRFQNAFFSVADLRRFYLDPTFRILFPLNVFHQLGTGTIPVSACRLLHLGLGPLNFLIMFKY